MAIFHKTLQYHEDTTEKRDISQEDIEFLKRLQLEMNTQDTTGTADPRFWVIKGSESVINNEDPDELCLQVDGRTVTSTTEETVKYLNDNILPGNNIDRENCRIETGHTQDFELTYMEDGEEVYEDLSTQEVNEFLANNGHDDTMIIGISIRPFMYPNTMFLTEKEAREHLERNYYHYSEDAHTYCMVAWRSPEVEKLWKILREIKWDCKGKKLERHKAPKTATGYEIGYEDGWNECLEKIVGGTAWTEHFIMPVDARTRLLMMQFALHQNLRRRFSDLTGHAETTRQICS